MKLRASIVISCAVVVPLAAANAARPNVVVVITDDQGWGDFGFHGNEVIRTPNLDRMAARSARLETFYVSPVCAPTRAALMTGRYTQRTRAIDTYVGRAMMDPEEITVAEVLSDAGYATGIFGKWHLGDCYPMRPQDQGFEEVLVHRGGGIGQPSDPEGGERKYTDAILFRNGERVETEGYCTDVYFDAATDWIRRQHEAEQPFFAYIATNAPHGPFHDVPAELLEEYHAIDLDPVMLGEPNDPQRDRLARIFAMITNIDDNVGRLFACLSEIGAMDDTLVLFLVDNGPNSRRFVGPMRGRKGGVHDGGVRSPLLAHWPARLEAGIVSGGIGAHIDLMPTILDACAVASPDGVHLDGASLLPLLEERGGPWPADRKLVIQAHRGDRAVRYHHFLLRTPRWKLVNASGFGPELDEVTPAFELYDMLADPGERNDLASEHPEIVADLRTAYDTWFDDVSSTRPDNYAPPRIHIGADEEPEVHLTRQDWRRLSDDGGWNRDSRGEWLVHVVDEGPFHIRVRFLPDTKVDRVTLRCGDEEWIATPAAGATDHRFGSIRLPLGPTRLEVDVESDDGVVGAYQVILSRN